jgi:hypothetical protein
VLIDGQNVREVTQDSLRAQIGMVTQDTSLLHRSVRDNILYGRPDADGEAMRARGALGARGLQPSGLQHPGHRAGHLRGEPEREAWVARQIPHQAGDAGAVVSFAPYVCEAMRVDGYDVVVNRPRASAYRAPGGTNAAFAVESVVDELAERLGLDPLEFRLRHAAREGDRRPDGVPYARIGNVECLRAIANSEHYRSPLGGKNRGRGVACGYWSNWGYWKYWRYG